MPKKGGLFAALAVFVVIVGLTVLVNGLLFGHGLGTDRSVSRYVGFETWSAVAFTLGNSFVAVMVGKYLWKIGRRWRMPRIFYYCSMIMLVALIWLSLCPIGYFDIDMIGGKSVISWIHEVMSRTMFIMMLAVSAMLATCPWASMLTRLVCAAYIIYGLFCIAGVMAHADWFESAILLYESAYIMSFVFVLASCRNRRIEVG